MIGRIAVGLLVVLASACEPEPDCEDDVRAQVLEETVELSVGGRSFTAELADEPIERDRGWKHRRCDRVALLLVPDEPGSELTIWGCALTEPLDAVFIAQGEVVAIERVAPCPEPCDACPSYGDGLLADAVLELPADSLDGLDVGSPASF